MIRFISSVVLSAALLSADQLVLTTGQVISGSYLGGDSRTVRFAVSDRVNTYSVADVRLIGFGETAATTAATQSPSTVSLPAGEVLEVRVLPAIGTQPGMMRGELYAPIYNGKTLVLPKGAECQVASVPKPAATLLYSAVVELRSVTVNGKTYSVSTDQTAVNAFNAMRPGHIVGFTLRLPLNIGQ